VSETLTIGGDLTFHRLGFGAMRVTGPGIWGPPPDRAAALRLLRHVVDSGVDFLDTADAYGPDVSEELIADALYPYPDGLVIATKGGNLRTGPGQWLADGRPEHLHAACEGSLRRLRLERIDLYQLHRVDSKVPLDEQIGALAALRSEGKIRHIGLSNVSAAQLARARAIVEIVSVQNRYNVSDRESEEVLEACERDGLAFLPWSPIGRGDLGSAQDALERIASAHRARAHQIALAWLLRRSAVMVPIPGTSSVSHFDENFAAKDVELTDEEFGELNEAAQG
jgi:pyridoxine 4-dehydrogenase